MVDFIVVELIVVATAAVVVVAVIVTLHFAGHLYQRGPSQHASQELHTPVAVQYSEVVQ